MFCQSSPWGFFFLSPHSTGLIENCDLPAQLAANSTLDTCAHVLELMRHVNAYMCVALDA